MSLQCSALLVLVAACLPGSFAAQTETPYRNGISFFQERQYEAAARELKAYLDNNPRPETIRDAEKALGLSEYFLGRYPDALPLLDRAAEASTDTDLIYALGMCNLRMHNPARARSAFARLFRVPAGSASASLLTAKLMIRDQMEDAALAQLTELRKQDPNLPELHYLMGELALFRGDVGEGIREIKQEIALNPGFSLAYYRLGDAYSRSRVWSEAERSLKQAIWLNPDFSSPYILLGKVYQQQEVYQSAEGMLRKAISMDPNNAAAHYQLGIVLQKTQREAEAREQFEIYKKLK
jgi:tetratricopeptide (TPR) repeat protein